MPDTRDETAPVAVAPATNTSPPTTEGTKMPKAKKAAKPKKAVSEKKAKRYSDPEKKALLAKIEKLKSTGKSTAEAIKDVGITGPTYYQWKNKAEGKTPAKKGKRGPGRPPNATKEAGKRKVAPKKPGRKPGRKPKTVAKAEGLISLEINGKTIKGTPGDLAKLLANL